MDFDKLTRDLETQDATIRLCAEAVRRRGQRLKEPALMAAADWLESDGGRGMVLDLSIREQVAPELPGEGKP